MASRADGKCVELTDKISPMAPWTGRPKAARGAFMRFRKSLRPKVKRAAPGGEGHMLNPIYADAIRHYLARFTAAFASYDGPKPRAQYHDSFEYRVNWSPDFFAQFEKRRGYRLQTELPALFRQETNDHVARVKCDYRETMSDMMVEDSLPALGQLVPPSAASSRATRRTARPATCSTSTRWPTFPRRKCSTRTAARWSPSSPRPPRTSPGSKLVAAETGTWLKEHFTETLADVNICSTTCSSPA